MELLERDDALAALTEARAAAARGEGRVVFVTGEPGIGKTSLVTRFVGDLEDGARVLLGTCDDLAIPRPLGPFHDLVGSVSPALEEALAAAAPSHEIHALVLAELALRPHPTVLVLEDVHWADDATLDSITVLGRRIGSIPAVLVLTFRGGEVPPGHALHAALGTIRPGDAVALELAPLSERAVASLAGDAADDVYAATGGNPFYVTELLAARSTDDPPPSVANAVLGRAARLDEASRRLVELVSVVPNRVSTGVLDAVMPDWPAAAEEPERRQLLAVDRRFVRFRHELARNAIRLSVPSAARRRLHGEILEDLLQRGADPAEIVHHAEAAGAEEVVADYALVAARRAWALGSNREAFSHYRRAADFARRLPAVEQASVFEELAAAAYVVGRVEDAFPAIERASAIYSELGDVEAVGRCTGAVSRYHWYAGDGDAARRKAMEAIEILEPLGESVELARAQSVLSQLAMLAEDAEQAVAWGERAIALALRLGDELTRAHALVNIGSAVVQVDPDDTATLLEGHAVADAAGDRHEATRALGNLAYTLMLWVRPAEALEVAEQALEYARRHEMQTLAPYMSATIAWLKLRAGEWEEAEQIVPREFERRSTVVQLLAKTVAAELAVRRGDPDAAERLADLASQSERTRELQRVAPILELATGWALTTGAPMPTDQFHRAVENMPRRGWLAIRLAAWAAVAGIRVEIDEPEPPTPHAAMARGEWRAAADGFGAVGWSYDRALLLSLLDDEESLAEAIEIARGLSAQPLVRRVAGRMRALGLVVPHGPRQSTRENPAGLTARQLEVLALLAGGLTNAEIADRLVVSPRTAEHHVAAVLRKLGAETRRDAARRASELGLQR